MTDRHDPASLTYGFARFVAKAGRENDLKAALLALVEPCRDEATCVRYDISQSTDQPALFYIYEEWTHREALTQHFKEPHIQAFMARADDLLAEPLGVGFSRMISPPAVTA